MLTRTTPLFADFAIEKSFREVYTQASGLSVFYFVGTGVDRTIELHAVPVFLIMRGTGFMVMGSGVAGFFDSAGVTVASVSVTGKNMAVSGAANTSGVAYSVVLWS